MFFLFELIFRRGYEFSLNLRVFNIFRVKNFVELLQTSAQTQDQ